MRMIAEHPAMQTLLREDRGRIPTFVEETLRVESPVSVTSAWHAHRRRLVMSGFPPVAR
jgi:cytochrome P450